MKRFFNGDDEDFGYFEDMDEGESQNISGEEYEILLGKANELQEIQLRQLQFELNQELLDRVITMLQNSWFWRFKSARARVKEIIITYKIFSKLTDQT